MKGGPIDAAIVSLENVLDDDIVGPKQFRLHIEGGIARQMPPRSSGTLGIARTEIILQLLFAKARGIPHADGLIQTRRDDQIVAGMKGRTHDVMIVAGQDTETSSLLKIPQPQGLIITGGQDPGKLRRVGMELDGANIIQMAQQGKETASQLVIPNLDFVIVATTDNEGFVQMKVHAADGAIVFFEAINHGSNAIIPTVIRSMQINRGKEEIEDGWW